MRWLLVMLLAGCSYPDKMLVSWELTSQEEEIVADSLAEWEMAMDKDLGLDLVFGWKHPFSFSNHNFQSHDDKATLYVVEAGSYGYRSVPDDNGFYTGMTKHGNEWSVVLVRLEDPTYFRAVALHEFGHFLGHRGHTPEGVMSSGVEDGNLPCVDQVSLDSICDQVGCGPRAQETCSLRRY